MTDGWLILSSFQALVTLAWPRPCIGSYGILSCIYVHTKFHWNWKNFLWMDGCTDVCMYLLTDRHFSSNVIRWIAGIYLKNKYSNLTNILTYSLLMLSSCIFVQEPRSARVLVNKSCGHMPHMKYLQTCIKQQQLMYKLNNWSTGNTITQYTLMLAVFPKKTYCLE